MQMSAGLSSLCDYGVDSESEDSECEILIKRKILLPSPNLSQVKVIGAEEDHIDDPQKHCNKIRSFPHARGDWASFVFISYPQNPVVFNLIEKLKGCLWSGEVIEECDDIHISISRTFVLKYHMISTFTSSLREAVLETKGFNLSFDSVKVYCNEEQTRTFIALKVDYISHKYLLSITEKLNKVLQEFSLPSFYKDPSFHASVLWVNGNKAEIIAKSLEKVNSELLELTSTSVFINTVCSKVGNKLFQYILV